MSEYLGILVVLAVLIIVPASVIYLLRAIRWLLGFVTGKHKKEAVSRELLRKEYLEPDWEAYREFLLREPPPNMVLLYELPFFVDNPIITVKEEEYYLNPIHNKDGLIEGMWFIGQSELGEPLFLQPGMNNFPIYKHELGPDIEVLDSDANEFFRIALHQYRESV